LLSDRRDTIADAVRFIAAGVVNTAISLAVYEIALFLMPPAPAYALSWCAGLAFLLVVYPSRVFPGGSRRAVDLIVLAASYIVVFLVGLAVLAAVAKATAAPRLAIVAALITTTLLNFALSRAILRRRGAGTNASMD
jgi:putative flippase GtrA